MGVLESWLWRRIIPKRKWLDSSSQYEAVKDHFAYEIATEYDRGADVDIYRIREYRDKDTGESVFWKRGGWTREFYEWNEFKHMSESEYITFTHEMLVIPRTAIPMEEYDLGR